MLLLDEGGVTTLHRNLHSNYVATPLGILESGDAAQFDHQIGQLLETFEPLGQ